MEGLGRLLLLLLLLVVSIALSNVFILRLAPLGSCCCARDLQVLQGLELLKRHLEVSVSLLKGYQGLRRVSTACTQAAVRVVTVGIEIAWQVTSMLCVKQSFA